jgi:hypothetical protein
MQQERACFCLISLDRCGQSGVVFGGSRLGEVKKALATRTKGE